ncbi:MAG TPA: hypothetical protein VN880_00200 [Solirubrobacteraceae bacterium]|nr:hypothetical protein [Solirubrobacteraceae bacterium]
MLRPLRSVAFARRACRKHGVEVSPFDADATAPDPDPHATRPGPIHVLAYRGGRIFVASYVWPEVLKEIR